MPILGPSGVASWNCERGVGSWALDTAKLAVAQDDAGPFIFTCLKILKRTRWVGPSPTGKGPWHLLCICTPGKNILNHQKELFNKKPIYLEFKILNYTSFNNFKFSLFSDN